MSSSPTYLAGRLAARIRTRGCLRCLLSIGQDERSQIRELWRMWFSS